MSSTSTSREDETKKDNWSTERYSSNASFVYSSQFTSPIIDLLAPRSGVSSSALSHTLRETDDNCTGNDSRLGLRSRSSHSRIPPSRCPPSRFNHWSRFLFIPPLDCKEFFISATFRSAITSTMDRIGCSRSSRCERRNQRRSCRCCIQQCLVALDERRS